MLALSWNRSRFYREIFGRAGIREQDLPHVALEQLPVVAKSELVERFDDAVTDQRLRRSDLEAWVQDDADPLHLYLDEYIVVHRSYGPERRRVFPYTRSSWNRMTAAVAPVLLPLEQGPERPLRSAFYMNVTGHFAGATNVRRASQSAHEALGLSPFDPIEETIARLEAFQPERLQSYPSALGWLAEWTLQGRLRIAPRTVLVSGERLTPAIRAQVREAWSAEIIDLYASAESPYMAARLPGTGRVPCIHRPQRARGRRFRAAHGAVRRAGKHAADEPAPLHIAADPLRPVRLRRPRQRRPRRGNAARGRRQDQRVAASATGRRPRCGS